MSKKLTVALLCGILIAGFSGCYRSEGKPPNIQPVDSVAKTDTPETEIKESISVPVITQEIKKTQTEIAETEIPKEQTPPQRINPSSPVQTESPKPQTAENMESLPPVFEKETTARTKSVPQTTAATKDEKAKPPAEPVKEKSIYDYGFNIEEIRNELISLGQSIGLIHITMDNGVIITPENSSWATPVTASQDFQGENLKRRLRDYVMSMPDLISAYGGENIEYFTIYIEELGNQNYRIYFLY